MMRTSPSETEPAWIGEEPGARELVMVRGPWTSPERSAARLPAHFGQ